MPDVLQDTRDRVIALGTEFTNLKERVEANSKILEELRDLQLKAKGGLTVGRAGVTAAKWLGTVASSGGFLWLVQHFPRGATP